MYVWKSEFLNSVIVIEASSVEAARQKAIGQMLNYMNETDDGKYYIYCIDFEEPYAHTSDGVVDAWNVFLNDINKNPIITDLIF